MAGNETQARDLNIGDKFEAFSQSHGGNGVIRGQVIKINITGQPNNEQIIYEGKPVGVRKGGGRIRKGNLGGGTLIKQRY